MAASKLNPFNLDSDDFNVPDLIPQMVTHNRNRNAPCNCMTCVVNASYFGVSCNVLATNPETGDHAWVPKLNKDNTMALALSPEHVRKVFLDDFRGDIPTFASHMITSDWRAFPRKVTDNRVTFTDKGKRKREAKEDTPAKRPANGAMAASSLMPSRSPTPTAETLIDVDEEY